VSVPSAGTCFGFSIQATVPFRYLRTGSGQPLGISVNASLEDPDDGDPIAQWTATPALPWDGRLYASEHGFRLWMGDVGWFSIDPDAGTITVPETDDPIKREERLWSIPAMLSFMARGDLPLHAAAVEVDDGAIVMAAPRMSGKTTLAGAMANAGYRLLSEDVTCVQPGATPQIIPGPAMLRLRPDVAAWLRLPNATELGEADDRVHFALDPERRGDCAPVPLRGIFLLRSGTGEVSVERVPPADAIRELWSQTSRLPTPEGRARCFEQLVDVVRAVPVWNLYRPMRAQDLPDTVRLLATIVQPAMS